MKKGDGMACHEILIALKDGSIHFNPGWMKVSPGDVVRIACAGCDNFVLSFAEGESPLETGDIRVVEVSRTAHAVDPTEATMALVTALGLSLDSVRMSEQYTVANAPRRAYHAAVAITSGGDVYLDQFCPVIIIRGQET